MDFFKYLISCIALAFYVAFGGPFSDYGTMFDVLVGFISIIIIVCILISILYVCVWIIKKNRKKTENSNITDKKDFIKVSCDVDNSTLLSKSEKMQNKTKADKKDFIK